MKGIQKTNAARILDRAGISYDLVPYEVDEKNLAADHVADQLGEPIDQVYKTLVLKGDRTGYLVCVVSGGEEVDLKKAAAASGNKKVEMIPQKDLLSVSGYIRGGCTSIGMKKKFPTFISADCLAFDFIYVSAGQRGLQLKIDPRDLVDITSAKICDIT